MSTGASAAPPTASYSCRADTKFGRHELSLRQVVDAHAPATVSPNTRFSITVSSWERRQLEVGAERDLVGARLREGRGDGGGAAPGCVSVLVRAAGVKSASFVGVPAGASELSS